MARNAATVDKVFDSALVSTKAAADAIIWLSHSPDLPTPDILEEDLGGVAGKVILNWQDCDRGRWCRAWFHGDGQFDWITCGPWDEKSERPIERDRDDFAVQLGAPKPMIDILNAMTRRAA